MDKTHSLLLVGVIIAVILALRFLPFLVFSGKRPTPKYILYLSRVLPCAVMGMLIVYCLREVSVTVYPYGLPELLAGAVVIGLQLWRKNSLLSIGVGTVLYIVLVQVVF